MTMLFGVVKAGAGTPEAGLIEGRGGGSGKA